MNATPSCSTLRAVCADFLAAALEVAAHSPQATAGEEGGRRASAPASHTLEPAQVAVQPPAVAVRLTEAAASADSVFGSTRLVERVAVDVLCASPNLPDGVVALARLLTAGAPAHEWTASLWQAGVVRLDVRTATSSEPFLRCFAHLVEQRVSDECAAARALELLPLAHADKPPEMLGLGGFQVELSFQTADGPQSSSTSAAELPRAPDFVATHHVLTELVRATALVGSVADIELEIGTRTHAAARSDERAPETGAASNPAGVNADCAALPTLQHAVPVAIRGLASETTFADRVVQAARAHLRARESALAISVSDKPDAAAAAGAAGGGAADDSIVGIGHAVHASGAAGKRFTWTITAVVAAGAPAPGVTPSHEASDAGANAAGGHIAPHNEAALYCFCQSALQVTPPRGVADCLRAKTTAIEWKSAFGLRLMACETTDAAACGRVRFAASGADRELVHPTLLVLHRRCKAPVPHAKLPPLGRKREASLVKAALAAALHRFKRASGSSTAFESSLRMHFLPSVATAIAKIVAGSGPAVQHAADMQMQHWQEQRVYASADDDAAEAAGSGAIEQAVLFGLHGALQRVGVAGDAMTPVTDGLPDDSPASTPAERDDESSSGVAASIDDQQGDQASPPAQPQDDSFGASHDDLPSDDDADAVFPTRNTKRRLEAPPPRTLTADQPHAACQRAPASPSDAAAAEWFL